MPRPDASLLNRLAPSRDVGLPVIDNRGGGTWRIKRADLKECLRLHRGGPHDAELVVARRHYDGANSEGDGAGYYANVFIAFREGPRTWRTQGVRILPAEAPRIARALERGTSSKPPPTEAPRLAGTGSGSITELRAAPIGDAVLLYVRYFHGGQQRFVRSRGIEIRDVERFVIAEGLRKLAKRRGRA